MVAPMCAPLCSRSDSGRETAEVLGMDAAQASLAPAFLSPGTHACEESAFVIRYQDVQERRLQHGYEAPAHRAADGRAVGPAGGGRTIGGCQACGGGAQWCRPRHSHVLGDAEPGAGQGGGTHLNSRCSPPAALRYTIMGTR